MENNVVLINENLLCLELEIFSFFLSQIYFFLFFFFSPLLINVLCEQLVE